MSVEPLSSWNSIMNKRGSQLIEVKSDWLFGSSKYRVCIIRPSFRVGAQHDEPFVICKSDKESWIYGKPSTVRNDNSLLIAFHLKSDELLKYLLKHKDSDSTKEPINGIESCLHPSFQKGNVSIASVTPFITQKQWDKRDENKISNLIIEIQCHLLKMQEKQLNKLGSKDARETVEDLQRQSLYDFQHKMIRFVDTAFYSKLIFNNKKNNPIMGTNMNGAFATHLSPNEFQLHLKSKLLSFGGRQTNFKANAECWKIENLSNEHASELLCINFKNGERLTKFDKNDNKKEYKATKISCHYSMKTLKFGVKYTIEFINNSRKHARG